VLRAAESELTGVWALARGNVVSPWRALHRFLIERLERRGVSVVKVRRRCRFELAEARVESALGFSACN